MNAIYNNSSSINLLNNNSKDITLINDKSITNQNLNKNKITKATKTDAITITEKDENIINKKKAFEAFDDACSEYNKTSSESDSAKIKIQYYMIAELMNSDSSNIPSFNIDDNADGDTEFLPFIDKMKCFVENNNITRGGVPMNKSYFLHFCDLYKEKLVQYNCK